MCEYAFGHGMCNRFRLNSTVKYKNRIYKKKVPGVALVFLGLSFFKAVKIPGTTGKIHNIPHIYSIFMHLFYYRALSAL